MTTEQAPSRRPTRARILDVCQQLFNESGPLAVTTAEIALAAGIQEGNLYYHFNKKEQILEALFDDFERALRDVAVADLAHGDKPERFGLYMSGWFSLMWEWRFFYRDGAAVCSLAPSLLSRIESLADEVQRNVRRVLDNMQAAGLLKATPRQMEQLVVNGWIVSTYWIDYLRSRHGINAITRDHISWGAAQVMGLFEPFLTAKGTGMLSIGAH
ncbi:TetR/AcrR family transcriptional regulator [Undibacterium sp. TJN25]|uniref:TetR/AcrR family transcriptional regulator n=1 Tax=Undibacterium sp. TJN25 TaxID=3413056 RepID=UPI003BF31D17